MEAGNRNLQVTRTCPQLQLEFVCGLAPWAQKQTPKVSKRPQDIQRSRAQSFGWAPHLSRKAESLGIFPWEATCQQIAMSIRIHAQQDSMSQGDWWWSVHEQNGTSQLNSCLALVLCTDLIHQLDIEVIEVSEIPLLRCRSATTASLPELANNSPRRRQNTDHDSS